MSFKYSTRVPDACKQMRNRRKSTCLTYLLACCEHGTCQCRTETDNLINSMGNGAEAELCLGLKGNWCRQRLHTLGLSTLPVLVLTGLPQTCCSFCLMFAAVVCALQLIVTTLHPCTNILLTMHTSNGSLCHQMQSQAKPERLTSTSGMRHCLTWECSSQVCVRIALEVLGRHGCTTTGAVWPHQLADAVVH